MTSRSGARPSHAVLFDAGGVLFREHGGAAFAPFERRYSVASREFLRALHDSAAHDRLRTGRIERPTYLPDVARELGRRYGGRMARMLDDWYGIERVADAKNVAPAAPSMRRAMRWSWLATPWRAWGIDWIDPG